MKPEKRYPYGRNADLKPVQMAVFGFVPEGDMKDKFRLGIGSRIDFDGDVWNVASVDHENKKVKLDLIGKIHPDKLKMERAMQALNTAIHEIEEMEMDNDDLKSIPFNDIGAILSKMATINESNQGHFNQVPEGSNLLEVKS